MRTCDGGDDDDDVKGENGVRHGPDFLLPLSLARQRAAEGWNDSHVWYIRMKMLKVN